MEAASETKLKELTSRHEEEEDDMFLDLSRHLKGKPNREEREKNILEKLKTNQEKERAAILDSVKEEVNAVHRNGGLEMRALEVGMDVAWQKEHDNIAVSLSTLAQTVAVDRAWVNAVVAKRVEAMDQYKDALMNDRDDLDEILRPSPGPDPAAPAITSTLTPTPTSSESPALSPNNTALESAVSGRAGSVASSTQSKVSPEITVASPLPDKKVVFSERSKPKPTPRVKATSTSTSASTGTTEKKRESIFGHFAR